MGGVGWGGGERQKETVGDGGWGWGVLSFGVLTARQSHRVTSGRGKRQKEGREKRGVREREGGERERDRQTDRDRET